MAPITRPTAVTPIPVQAVRKDSAAGGTGLDALLKQYSAQGGTLGQRTAQQAPRQVTSTAQTRAKVQQSMSRPDKYPVVFSEASRPVAWEKIAKSNRDQIRAAGENPILSKELVVFIPLVNGEHAYSQFSLTATEAADFLNDIVSSGQVNPQVSLTQLLSMNGLTDALIMLRGQFIPVPIWLNAKPGVEAVFGSESLFETPTGNWSGNPLVNNLPYIKVSANSSAAKVKGNDTGGKLSISGYLTKQQSANTLAGGTIDITINPGTPGESVNGFATKQVGAIANKIVDQLADTLGLSKLPSFISKQIKAILKKGVDEQIKGLKIDLPGFLGGIGDPESVIGKLGSKVLLTVSLDAVSVGEALKVVSEFSTASRDQRADEASKLLLSGMTMQAKIPLAEASKSKGYASANTWGDLTPSITVTTQAASAAVSNGVVDGYRVNSSVGMTFDVKAGRLGSVSSSEVGLPLSLVKVDGENPGEEPLVFLNLGPKHGYVGVPLGGKISDKEFLDFYEGLGGASASSLKLTDDGNTLAGKPIFGWEKFAEKVVSDSQKLMASKGAAGLTPEELVGNIEGLSTVISLVEFLLKGKVAILTGPIGIAIFVADQYKVATQRSLEENFRLGVHEDWELIQNIILGALSGDVRQPGSKSLGSLDDALGWLKSLFDYAAQQEDFDVYGAYQKLETLAMGEFKLPRDWKYQILGGGLGVPANLIREEEERFAEWITNFTGSNSALSGDDYFEEFTINRILKEAYRSLYGESLMKGIYNVDEDFNDNASPALEALHKIRTAVSATVPSTTNIKFNSAEDVSNAIAFAKQNTSIAKFQEMVGKIANGHNLGFTQDHAVANHLGYTLELKKDSKSDLPKLTESDVKILGGDISPIAMKTGLKFDNSFALGILEARESTGGKFADFLVQNKVINPFQLREMLLSAVQLSPADFSAALPYIFGVSTPASRELGVGAEIISTSAFLSLADKLVEVARSAEADIGNGPSDLRIYSTQGLINKVAQIKGGLEAAGETFDDHLRNFYSVTTSNFRSELVFGRPNVNFGIPGLANLIEAQNLTQNKIYYDAFMSDELRAKVVETGTSSDAAKLFLDSTRISELKKMFEVQIDPNVGFQSELLGFKVKTEEELRNDFLAQFPGASETELQSFLQAFVDGQTNQGNVPVVASVGKWLHVNNIDAIVTNNLPSNYKLWVARQPSVTYNAIDKVEWVQLRPGQRTTKVDYILVQYPDGNYYGSKAPSGLSSMPTMDVAPNIAVQVVEGRSSPADRLVYVPNGNSQVENLKTAKALWLGGQLGQTKVKSLADIKKDNKIYDFFFNRRYIEGPLPSFVSASAAEPGGGTLVASEDLGGLGGGASLDPSDAANAIVFDETHIRQHFPELFARERLLPEAGTFARAYQDAYNDVIATGGSEEDAILAGREALWSSDAGKEAYLQGYLSSAEVDLSEEQRFILEGAFNQKVDAGVTHSVAIEEAMALALAPAESQSFNVKRLVSDLRAIASDKNASNDVAQVLLQSAIMLLETVQASSDDIKGNVLPTFFKEAGITIDKLGKAIGDGNISAWNAVVGQVGQTIADFSDEKKSDVLKAASAFSVSANAFKLLAKQQDNDEMMFAGLIAEGISGILTTAGAKSLETPLFDMNGKPVMTTVTDENGKKVEQQVKNVTGMTATLRNGAYAKTIGATFVNIGNQFDSSAAKQLGYVAGGVGSVLETLGTPTVLRVKKDAFGKDVLDKNGKPVIETISGNDGLKIGTVASTVGETLANIGGTLPEGEALQITGFILDSAGQIVAAVSASDASDLAKIGTSVQIAAGGITRIGNKLQDDFLKVSGTAVDGIGKIVSIWGTNDTRKNAIIGAPDLRFDNTGTDLGDSFVVAGKTLQRIAGTGDLAILGAGAEGAGRIVRILSDGKGTPGTDLGDVVRVAGASVSDIGRLAGSEALIIGGMVGQGIGDVISAANGGSTTGNKLMLVGEDKNGNPQWWNTGVDSNRTLAVISAGANAVGGLLNYFGQKQGNEELAFVGTAISQGVSAFQKISVGNNVIGGVKYGRNMVLDGQADLVALGGAAIKTFVKGDAGRILGNSADIAATIMRMNAGSMSSAAGYVAIAQATLSIMGVEMSPEAQFMINLITTAATGGPIGWAAFAIGVLVNLFSMGSFERTQRLLSSVDADGDMQFDDNIDRVDSYYRNFFGGVKKTGSILAYDVNGVNPYFLEHARYSAVNEVIVGRNTGFKSSPTRIAVIDGKPALRFNDEVISGRLLNSSGQQADYSIKTVRQHSKSYKVVVPTKGGSFTFVADDGRRFNIGTDSEDGDRFFSDFTYRTGNVVVNISGVYNPINPGVWRDTASKSFVLSQQQYKEFAAEAGAAAIDPSKDYKNVIEVSDRNDNGEADYWVNNKRIKVNGSRRDNGFIQVGDTMYRRIEHSGDVRALPDHYNSWWSENTITGIIKGDDDRLAPGSIVFGMLDQVKANFQSDGDKKHVKTIYTYFDVNQDGNPDLVASAPDGSVTVTLKDAAMGSIGEIKAASFEEAVDIGSMTDILARWGARNIGKIGGGTDVAAIYAAAKNLGLVADLKRFDAIGGELYSILLDPFAFSADGIAALEAELNGIIARTGGLFDADAYIKANQDLVPTWAGVDAASAAMHYIRHGHSEGRSLGNMPKDVFKTDLADTSDLPSVYDYTPDPQDIAAPVRAPAAAPKPAAPVAAPVRAPAAAPKPAAPVSAPVRAPAAAPKPAAPVAAPVRAPALTSDYLDRLEDTLAGIVARAKALPAPTRSNLDAALASIDANVAAGVKNFPTGASMIRSLGQTFRKDINAINLAPVRPAAPKAIVAAKAATPAKPVRVSTVRPPVATPVRAPALTTDYLDRLEDTLAGIVERVKALPAPTRSNLDAALASIDANVAAGVKNFPSSASMIRNLSQSFRKQLDAINPAPAQPIVKGTPTMMLATEPSRTPGKAKQLPKQITLPDSVKGPKPVVAAAPTAVSPAKMPDRPSGTLTASQELDYLERGLERFADRMEEMQAKKAADYKPKVQATINQLSKEYAGNTKAEALIAFWADEMGLTFKATPVPSATPKAEPVRATASRTIVTATRVLPTAQAAVVAQAVSTTKPVTVSTVRQPVATLAVAPKAEPVRPTTSRTAAAATRVSNPTSRTSSARLAANANK